MQLDESWQQMIGNGAITAVLVWLNKGSIARLFEAQDRRLNAIELQNKIFLERSEKVQEAVGDLSSRLAAHGDQINALSQSVGELKGFQKHLDQRINGMSADHKARLDALEERK